MSAARPLRSRGPRKIVRAPRPIKALPMLSPSMLLPSTTRNALPFPFRDPRYAELLFRYRARNWPETLDAGERERWEAFRRARLTRVTALTTLTLEDYFATLAALRADPARQEKLTIIDQLQAWGEELAAGL